MTIQEMGALGEVIGAIAIIITLIFLALQIRQNTKAVILNTGHAITEEFRSMFELIAANGELAELINKSANTDVNITGADKARYWAYTSNFIYAFENAYFQSAQGALDSNKWAGMKRMVTDYAHLPGFQEYWPSRKHWYSDTFQHFMESDILRSEAKVGVPLPGAY